MEKTTVEKYNFIYSGGYDVWSVPVLSEFLSEEFQKIEASKSDGPLRVFVPLCGKTPDIIWLSGRGHTVVGVEWIEDVVIALFETAKISYTVHNVTIANDISVPVYTSNDNTITIYVGDFFAFKDSNQLGHFDFVWDNGTFAGFPPSQRPNYANIIANLLQKSDKMLLAAFGFNQREPLITPYAMTPSDVIALYGSQFEIKLIKSEEADTISKAYRENLAIVNFKKLENFSWNFHLLIKN